MIPFLMPSPSQSTLCVLLLTVNQNQATNVLIFCVYLGIQTKVVTQRVALLIWGFFTLHVQVFYVTFLLFSQKPASPPSV